MEDRAHFAEVAALEALDEFGLIQIVVDFAVDQILELVGARQIVDGDDALFAALVFPAAAPITFAASALILAGCGYDGDVRDFINDTYVLQSSNGDTAVYASDDPVGPTTSTIVNAVNPAARQSDGSSEYLRYDDDIVIVSAALGGSTVRVEDLDGRYRGGFFAFLGPGFRPGAPGTGFGGGPGEVK